MNTNKQKSMYIHIPFCEHICYYCDFNKVFLEGQPVDEYVDRLLDEIEWGTKNKTTSFPTIYIGGGTPTSLTATQLDKLLAGITERVSLADTQEFTIEANPGDLTEEKLAIMKTYGINRLSMGVQSFDDRLLKKIGRKHTASDVIETLHLLERKGFHNVSIDLIYALPGQTIENFRQTLFQALAFDLPHYSLYSLILENKTMFMNWVRKGNMVLPSQEIELQMFEETIEAMTKAGKQHYEISNFAQPGYESKHNLMYWNNEEYYGFGAGASGYVNQERYRNFGPIQHYLKPLKKGQQPIYQIEKLSEKEKMEEELFLGLRKMAGISKRMFAKKFGQSYDSVYGEVTKKLVQKGWLNQDQETVCLTKQGIYIGNNVFEQFLLDK